MKKRFVILFLTMFALVSCGNDVTEEKAIIPETPANSIIQENTKRATISSDESNEANEIPEIGAQTGETATSTDFIGSGSTLTETGN